MAGWPIERDRAAEFTATGDVRSLVARAEAAKVGLAADVRAGDYAAPLHASPPAEFEGPERPLTQGAALQHVYEELAQHHGQMQIIRDVLLAQAGDAARP